MKKFLLIVFLLFSQICSAGDRYPATIEKVVDGDTVVATVKLRWNVGIVSTSFRLLDFDAWEISRKRKTVKFDSNELEKGRKAKVELENLIKDGEVFFEAKDGDEIDPYGRPLARMFVLKDGQMIEVSKYMKERGHDRTKSNSNAPKGASRNKRYSYKIGDYSKRNYKYNQITKIPSISAC